MVDVIYILRCLWFSLVGCFAGPQAILFVPRVLQAYDYYNTSKADDYEIGK